jgi:hypothetical protein
MRRVLVARASREGVHPARPCVPRGRAYVEQQTGAARACAIEESDPMSEGHHDLAHEFPQHVERIRALKQSDAHFARLAGNYHDLAKELSAIAAGTETPGDLYVEALKKKRLAVLDELYGMLAS